MGTVQTRSDFQRFGVVYFHVRRAGSPVTLDHHELRWKIYDTGLYQTSYVRATVFKSCGRPSTLS